MTSYGPYPGTVLSEHDGDTLRVTIHVGAPSTASAPVDIGWDVWLHPGSSCDVVVDVRTFGDNAAELYTPAGKVALTYLGHLLPPGSPVRLLSHGWDKYGGRSDCSITLPDGRDLTAVMVAAGQAAPWNGQGPKPVPGPVPGGPSGPAR